MNSDRAAGVTLSVPGKTFLVGEYLALTGGPSLLLATEPRFELRVGVGSSMQNPFHPDSPAGKLWQSNRVSLSNLKLEFRDPHEGRGGLGASSAQFALLYAYLVEAEPSEFQTSKFIAALLIRYRECAWNGEGKPPSGADLVAQLCGQLVDFDGVNNVAKSCSWSFSDLAFTLIRTGAKLATHEHLRKPLEVPSVSLRAQVEEAKTALRNMDSAALSRSVETYGSLLEEAGFVSPQTTEILRELRAANAASQLGIVALKGCGAMGADVILALHRPEKREALANWLSTRGLKTCGSDTKLATGLQMKTETKN